MELDPESYRHLISPQVEADPMSNYRPPTNINVNRNPNRYSVSMYICIPQEVLEDYLPLRAYTTAGARDYLQGYMTSIELLRDIFNLLCRIDQSGTKIESLYNLADRPPLGFVTLDASVEYNTREVSFHISMPIWIGGTSTQPTPPPTEDAAPAHLTVPATGRRMNLHRPV